MSAGKFGGRLRGLGAAWQNNTQGWLTRSQIKSIQRATVAIAAGATTGNVTINAVRTENTVIRFLGYSNSGNAATVTEDNCYIELTTTTNIRATHTTAGNDIVASFDVIEYVPGVIRLVQRGLISIINGQATGSATITAVDTAKTELESLGYAFTGTASADERPRFALAGVTTVTATRIGTTDAITQSFQSAQWW